MYCVLMVINSKEIGNKSHGMKKTSASAQNSLCLTMVYSDLQNVSNLLVMRKPLQSKFNTANSSLSSCK